MPDAVEETIRRSCDLCSVGDLSWKFNRKLCGWVAFHRFKNIGEKNETKDSQESQAGARDKKPLN